MIERFGGVKAGGRSDEVVVSSDISLKDNVIFVEIAIYSGNAPIKMTSLFMTLFMTDK